ncbi:MAG: hypothetical protein FJ265_04850 [Planctomycetes bacterium]|nr:hypothetical protein [Planctomycetota bacterium]
MRRRHRDPPPLPPPLGGIVIDGSNVIASGSGRATDRLDLAVAWCQRWRPDLPVQVFVDATTARRCRPEIQDVLRARCLDVTPGRARYAVTPRGESADPHVLQHARRHRALVVSNDRYFDYEDLRANVVTVQFTLARDEFTVFEEATWFRQPGSALRVPLVELQRLGAPGGDGGAPAAPGCGPLR